MSSEPTEEKTRKPISTDRINRIAAWVVTALITLGFIYWLYRPAVKHFIFPDPTPTLVQSTPTQLPTRTPTIEPLPTQQVYQTQAPPSSPSKFFVADLSNLDTPLPEASGASGYIINDQDAITNPPFSDLIWTTSDTIGQQIGAEVDEPFHATFGAAEVTWKMDIPLPAGIYDIYVMDTLVASGGSLDFMVYNDETEIFPYLGNRHVEFYSTRENPPQHFDYWHSIGTYNLDHEGTLSVRTRWDKRDERTVVAVDRVIIIPRPAATYTILSRLPLGKQIYVMDDPLAEIVNASTVIEFNKGTAWNGSAQVIVNPEDTVRVTWKAQDPVPVGKYEVWAWLPELNGTAQSKYYFMINDDFPKTVEGTDPGPIVHGGRAGGQWVVLGQVNVGLFYSPSAHLKVVMEPVTGATIGELGVDAIALIKLE